MVKKGKKNVQPTKKMICKHCGKTVNNPGLIGLSLVCMFCKKPINGL